MKQPTTHIFVVYDSITNSVFAGQVLQPLLEQLQREPTLTVILVSFERTHLNPEQIKKYIPEHPRLRPVILKKIPFIGSVSLLYAAYFLQKALAPHATYTLTARGPLAGSVALHAIDRTRCRHIIIQARGLLAEEYKYARRTIVGLLGRIITAFRAYQFRAIEAHAYGTKKQLVTVHAVSPALKDYLITTFKTHPSTIIIAEHDIPRHLAPDLVHQYKIAVRTQLNIPIDTHVYCYNGSAKPWQCPELVVRFFKKELDKQNDIFLLILTEDLLLFQQLLAHAHIDTKKYAILSVSHADIYRYLAACNTGIIFREPHVINWVSRPTKILEYRAAHLNVVHNDTIAYAIKTQTSTKNN